MDVGGAGQPVETVAGEGLGDGSRQMALPLRLVRMTTNEGREASSLLDVRIGSHGVECNPCSRLPKFAVELTPAGRT